MSSRYAEVHKNPKGPGDARPTALQIVKDSDMIGKLSGKVALITGVSSGIGIETAKALKAAGIRVIGAVRNLEKAKEALKDDLEPGHLELIHLDMNSLDSVRACAKDFLAKSPTLNIIINNAGIMMCPEGRTADGFELQLGTNHFSHFLLFQLLKPALLASATPEFPSRVVSVTSVAHRDGIIHFDNLKMEGIYDPVLAYGQSKLANLYFSNEIERRYGSLNLHSNAVMPGGIFSGLQQHLPQEVIDAWNSMPGLNEMFKNAEQGAATSVWAAVGPEWTHTGGKYLEDCGVAGPAKEGAVFTEPGYSTLAFDEESAKKLWEVSCELVGVADE